MLSYEPSKNVLVILINQVVCLIHVTSSPPPPAITISRNRPVASPAGEEAGAGGCQNDEAVFEGAANAGPEAVVGQLAPPALVQDVPLVYTAADHVDHDCYNSAAEAISKC